MAGTQFDSVLAKKLNAFVALSPKELKALAEIQSKPITVKRGKQLIEEGQTGHKPSFFKPAGRAATKTLPMASARSSPFPSPATAWDCAACCCEPLITPSPP